MKLEHQINKTAMIRKLNKVKRKTQEKPVKDKAREKTKSQVVDHNQVPDQVLVQVQTLMNKTNTKLKSLTKPLRNKKMISCLMMIKNKSGIKLRKHRKEGIMNFKSLTLTQMSSIWQKILSKSKKPEMTIEEEVALEVEVEEVSMIEVVEETSVIEEVEEEAEVVSIMIEEATMIEVEIEVDSTTEEIVEAEVEEVVASTIEVASMIEEAIEEEEASAEEEEMTDLTIEKAAASTSLEITIEMVIKEAIIMDKTSPSMEVKQTTRLLKLNNL